MQSRPDVMILDGTPRFASTEQWEIDGVRKLAADNEAEVWTSANLHRTGQEADERGVPAEVARFDKDLDVIIHLCPQSDHVQVKITKEHGNQEVAQVRMELDPSTMLLTSQS